MLLPQSTYCSEGLANFNVMMITMIIIIIIIIIMTIVSVEQRPGWGEHVSHPAALHICEFDTKQSFRLLFLRVFFQHASTFSWSFNPKLDKFSSLPSGNLT